MDVMVLRFENVIGPLSWHKKRAVTAFFKAIIESRPIKIFGNGAAKSDFHVVGDLCAGIESVLERRLQGLNALRSVPGREVSSKEWADVMCAVAGRPNHTMILRERRAGEVPRDFASCEAAKERLWFVPQFVLEDAFCLTGEWR
jgi:nucleoside-diphosphate-sugar epimerase